MWKKRFFDPPHNAYTVEKQHIGKSLSLTAVLEAKPSQIFSPEVESNYSSSNLVANYNELQLKSSMINILFSWNVLITRVELGHGGSGIVQLAQWRHTEVAVKEFLNQGVLANDFIREAEIHAKLRHPNVVQLLAVSSNPLSLLEE